MHVCIFQSLRLEGSWKFTTQVSCVGGLLVLLIFLLRFVFTVWRGDEACTSPGPGQEPWCLGPQSERSQVFYVRRSRAQSPRCPRVAQWPLRPGTGPEPRSTGRLRLLSPPIPGTMPSTAGPICCLGSGKFGALGAGWGRAGVGRPAWASLCVPLLPPLSQEPRGSHHSCPVTWCLRGARRVSSRS